MLKTTTGLRILRRKREKGITVMHEKTLQDILKLNYGIESSSLEFFYDISYIIFIEPVVAYLQGGSVV